MITQAIYYFKVKKSKLYLVSVQNIHVENENHRAKVSFDKKVILSLCDEQHLAYFKDVKENNLDLLDTQ